MYAVLPPAATRLIEPVGCKRVEQMMRGWVMATAMGVMASASALAQVDPELRRANFAVADADGNGFVDEAEFAGDVASSFAALDRNKNSVLAAAEMDAPDRAAFAKVDRDGDGGLTFTEVMDAKLVEFAQVDKNGDGRISLEEYLSFPGNL